MFKKIIAIFLLLIVSMLLLGCGITKVADIKKDSMLGKTVTVTGTVKSTFKVGSLAGYALTMQDGELWVASSSLPKEGSKVSVKGVVMQEFVVGYYLNATN